MTDPSGPVMLKRFYVEGVAKRATASFGIPINSLENALALCQRQHARGYRQLRIHDTHTHRVCRFHIQYGALGWEPEPKDATAVPILRVGV